MSTVPAKPNRAARWQPYVLRAVAIASLVLIIVLSWVPGEDRPHTGVSNLLEHFAAYALSAGANLIAFVPARRLGMVLAWMIALAAIAEIGQNFIPGREARVIDFGAGSAGAVAAGIAFTLARRR